MLFFVDGCGRAVGLWGRRLHQKKDQRLSLSSPSIPSTSLCQTFLLHLPRLPPDPLTSLNSSDPILYQSCLAEPPPSLGLLPLSLPPISPSALTASAVYLSSCELCFHFSVACYFSAFPLIAPVLSLSCLPLPSLALSPLLVTFPDLIPLFCSRHMQEYIFNEIFIFML